MIAYLVESSEAVQRAYRAAVREGRADLAAELHRLGVTVAQMIALVGREPTQEETQP